MKKIITLSLVSILSIVSVFASSGVTWNIKPLKDNGNSVTNTPNTTKNPIKGLIILNDFYAVDENFVYAVNATHTTWVKMPTADRVSFKVLSGQFARDTDQIFQMGKIIIGADRESFTPIAAQYGYAKDKDHIYGPHGIISQADLSTFKTISKDYALDSGTVFFDGKVVPEANSGSFEVIDKGLYAVDDKNVFYAGKILENTSPEGFTVKGPRAFAADGRTFLDGQVEKGEPTKNTGSQTSQYWSHFTGKNLPFWTLMGIAYLVLFSFIFVFFADRNDEEVSFLKTIIKSFVAIVIGVMSFWIVSLFASEFAAQIVGVIIALIIFMVFWGVLGWIKSLLITLLTLIAFVFLLSIGGLIAHSFFGDFAHFLSFLEKPEIRMIGIMKMVGFFIGTWLIMTQLGSSLFRAAGQAIVATVIGAGLLFFLLWLGNLGTVISVILFSGIYGVILWIMRFRMVSNLFAETVRIVRISLIVSVAVGILIWIIL